jgi:hypothetical protein
MNMLTGQSVYLSAVMRESGEVLAIPPEKLKAIITEEPTLSGPEDSGLSPLQGRSASQGVRSPQPAAPPLDRAERGRGGRNSARKVRRAATGDAGRNLAGRKGAEEPLERRACKDHRPRRGYLPGTNVRDHSGRSRTGRVRCRGLRGLGGPCHLQPGSGGPGGSGRYVIADRELLRLPRGPFRSGACQPRFGTGRQVRCPDRCAPRSSRLEEREQPLQGNPLGGW